MPGGQSVGPELGEPGRLGVIYVLLMEASPSPRRSDSLLLTTASVNRPRGKSVAHAVRSRIQQAGFDRLWTYADFRGLAPMAVAATLSRLVKAGQLRRIRRGVYRRSKPPAAIS